jgi:hypothetical protein
MGDKADEAGVRQLALNSHQKFGIEGIGQIVDHDAYDIRRLAAQTRRAAVIDITHTLHCRTHSGSGLRPNSRAALQYQRNRGFRHAGGMGHRGNSAPCPARFSW